MDVMTVTVGVLALQGAFVEHLALLRKAAAQISARPPDSPRAFEFIEVRTEEELARCDGLIIPGGESTTLSLVAARSGILEPLREFVKYDLFVLLLLGKFTYHQHRVERKPTWGTCAGLIMLAEAANATKKGGQELIGGLDVRVHRNHFGRQIESFESDLTLPFLAELDPSSARPPNPFPGIFIRAPIVDKVLPHMERAQVEEALKAETIVAPSKQPKDEKAAQASSGEVKVLGVLTGRKAIAIPDGGPTLSDEEAGDIIAVKQGNVFGTSFHPELTDDVRIHLWWLKQVLKTLQP